MGGEAAQAVTAVKCSELVGWRESSEKGRESASKQAGRQADKQASKKPDQTGQ